MSIVHLRSSWNNVVIPPWIMVSFAVLNMMILGGNRRSFGAFVAELRKDFSNITLTELNWIGDSYAAVGFMSSCLSTTAILFFDRRFDIFQLIGSFLILSGCVSSSLVSSPHWLFLSHTLITGIGSSIVISVAGLVVNDHFDVNHRLHLLATTLVSGGSLATIAFVYFFAFLIHVYDWRAAFFILGIIYFVVSILSAAVFQRCEHNREVQSKSLIYSFSGITRLQVPLLGLWFLERVMTSVVTYGLLLNLTDYVLFAAGEGAIYLIVVIAIALNGDIFKNNLRYILFASSVLATISLLMMEFTSERTIVIRMLCLVTGIALGPSNIFLFPAAEELTKLPGHIAYPFSLGGMGFGMLISPLLTAKIAEIFLYKWFFLVQGCLILFKVLCLGLMSLILAMSHVDPLDKDYEVEVNDELPVQETTRLIHTESAKYGL